MSTTSNVLQHPPPRWAKSSSGSQPKVAPKEVEEEDDVCIFSSIGSYNRRPSLPLAFLSSDSQSLTDMDEGSHPGVIVMPTMSEEKEQTFHTCPYCNVDTFTTEMELKLHQPGCSQNPRNLRRSSSASLNRGRGRSAARSLARAVRSRSPFRSQRVRNSDDTSMGSQHSVRGRSPFRKMTGAVAMAMNKAKSSSKIKPIGREHSANSLPTTLRTAFSDVSSVADDITVSTIGGTMSLAQSRVNDDASVVSRNTTRSTMTVPEDSADDTEAYEVSLQGSSHLLEHVPAKPKQQPQQTGKQQMGRTSLTPRSRTPKALRRRFTTDEILSTLKVGSGASAAVQTLRERERGIVKSRSRIRGISIPNYSGYVSEAVDTFRKGLGVSDEKYEELRSHTSKLISI